MSVQHSLLVIDDDAKFRLIISKILEGSGFDVQSVPSISGALALLEERQYDLIILDLNLINETGSEFLAYREKRPSLSNVPVIVCSSEKRREVVKQVINHGACDYIIKPIKQSVVLRKIKKALKYYSNAEHVFEDDEKKLLCSLTVEAEVITLGEAYCKVKSPARLPKGMKFFLERTKHENETRLFEGRTCRTNTDSKSQSGAYGYETFATMIGVTEEEADETRKAKAGWSK